MNNTFDESDQVAIVYNLFDIHLQKKDHNGKPKEGCPFCEAFIFPPKLAREYPLESYSFVILDISDENSVVKVGEIVGQTFQKEIKIKNEK